MIYKLKSIKPSMNKYFNFYGEIKSHRVVEQKGEKKYYVSGKISTTDPDAVRDIVTQSGLDDMHDQMMRRVMKLDFEHEAFRAMLGESEDDVEVNKTKRPLGKAIHHERRDNDIFVDWELNPTWKKFNKKGDIVLRFEEIWKDIENGFYDAFSIAFVPVSTENVMVNGMQNRLLNKLELLNVALTGNPVNPAATMTTFSAVAAKSLDFIKQNEVKTMEESQVKGLSDSISDLAKQMKSLHEEVIAIKGMYKKEKKEDMEDEEKRKETKEYSKEQIGGMQMKSFSEKIEVLEKSNADLKSQYEELNNIVSKAQNSALASTNTPAQKSEDKKIESKGFNSIFQGINSGYY